MGLTTYRRKRDFARTAEPRGRVAARKGPLAFVVQKHDASHLHYDFRLELNGVLLSWAVPKGPSLNPADKRLAVRVEDHPVDYGSFEGTIPAGEYGGGTVMLWDRGTWEPLDSDPDAALRKGKLTFELHGERLHGAWTLTRMHGDRSGDGKNWLLIKRRDADAHGNGKLITDVELTSVKSGRTMPEIASNGKVHHSNRKSKKKARASGPRLRPPEARPDNGKLAHAATAAPAYSRPAAVPGAVKAPMPARFDPELCTLVDEVPTGPDWLHEIKFDGYRFIVRKNRKSVQIITRTGKDWSAKFEPIMEAVKSLPAKSAILDGEATILDPSGRSTFQGLQRAIKERRFEKLAFFLFDLPYLDGYNLAAARLLDRKQLLQSVLQAQAHPVLRYSDHVLGGGQTIQRQVCNLELEGAVSKRIDSAYQQFRTADWVKTKCDKRQEFVIVGFTPPHGSRKDFGSLLLAAHDDDGKLVYTGRVGTGFDFAALGDIMSRLEPLRRRTIDVTPPQSEAAGARWVSPKLVAEVRFTEWTGDGRLRHPVFQGLREDKEAADVIIEKPRQARTRPNARDNGSHVSVGSLTAGRGAMNRSKAGRPGTRAAARSAPAGDNVVAGVTISNPDRVVFPDAGLTKLDVARYYELVAPLILPYIQGRPISTVRCPQGRAKVCFFQKHVDDTFPNTIEGVRVREKNGVAQYIAIDSVEGLISLIQFGVLELHPWGAASKDIEHPDLLTFDLDPGPKVTFDMIKEAALAVRDVLAAVKLESFPKTSGGKGLHVCVPLRPDASWDEARAFAKAVALYMERLDPSRYVANMSKSKRAGRIFVDYLRNGRGATSVAPYSVRARDNAPVSMPIRWDDLPAITSAAEFTIAGAAAYLKKRRRDPWQNFLKTRQRLPEPPAPHAAASAGRAARSRPRKRSRAAKARSRA